MLRSVGLQVPSLGRLHLQRMSAATTQKGKRGFATFSSDGSYEGAKASSDGHYDVIVIGSGAGIKISIPAAKLGLKVAMCERGFDVYGEHKTGLGGTCLTRGCIPSKMLIHPADVATHAEHAREKLNLSISPPTFEEQRKLWPDLVGRVTDEVDSTSNSLNKVYSKEDPSSKRDWFQDSARFIAPKTLQCGKHTIRGDKIFICSGSSPTIPPIPGLDDTPYMTSTEALRRLDLPKRLIVLGAGYIATELSHAYSAMGSTVTMVARSQVLRNVDEEVREDFLEHFRKRVECLERTEVDRVEYEDNSKIFTVHLSNKDSGKRWTQQSEALLVATGFSPSTPDLDLAKAGVDTVRPSDGTGFIKVDDQLRTTAKDVYSFGDVAGNFLFRHSANYEGSYLAEHIIYPWAQARENGSEAAFLEKEDHYPEIDYSRIPWAMFTNPQIAGVGLQQNNIDLYNRFVQDAESSGLLTKEKLSEQMNDVRLTKCIVNKLDPEFWDSEKRREVVKTVKALQALDISIRRCDCHGEPCCTLKKLGTVVGRCHFKNSAQGDARLPDSGMVKIWIQEDQPRRILGCVISGDEASVLLHQIVALMQVKGTLDDLILMVYAHPSLSEIVRNAARNARDELDKRGHKLPLNVRLA